jgi:acetaldehyde/propanal dehydrogenase
MILGSGNIATDLLVKALRSGSLKPLWMVGIDPDSEGLRRARELGVSTWDRGLEALLAEAAPLIPDIIFDATSAGAHVNHDSLLDESAALLIDLTPAALGPFCVPHVNTNALRKSGVRNVNMVTCGGQATVPIVAAINRVQDVEYAEIVATIASRSAGPGTRQNIDEFTRTTARALEVVGGAARGKAIIILNPAEPPLMMRNTVHCLTRAEPNGAAIEAAVAQAVAEVQKYVPGYRLSASPVVDGRRVSVFLEVSGLGDFLPEYAGNLDIMTAAALRVAEMAVADAEERDLA